MTRSRHTIHHRGHCTVCGYDSRKKARARRELYRQWKFDGQYPSPNKKGSGHRNHKAYSREKREKDKIERTLNNQYEQYMKSLTRPKYGNEYGFREMFGYEKKTDWWTDHLIFRLFYVKSTS